MPPDLSDLRAAIRRATRMDETERVRWLLKQVPLAPEDDAAIAGQAETLARGARADRRGLLRIEAFLQEFSLSSDEGVALMMLAEALLRIPDADTADRFIADRIRAGDWSAHVGRNANLAVDASSRALALTGRILGNGEPAALGALAGRLGAPVIRQAVRRAVALLADQFVAGRTIAEALRRGEEARAIGHLHSFDMLGEAARTANEAARHLARYHDAAAEVAKASEGRGPRAESGISVKLTALHPRYDYAHRDDAVPALAERLLGLAAACRDAGLELTVDAEEAHRLDISLDIIERVFTDPSLGSWEGFGLAVQAYQKRAPDVIDWLAALARGAGRRLGIRLVKGAYWDTEIKAAQVDGLDGYPVYTRKASTDVSYLACAARLLAARDAIFPMFATHNARTLASVFRLAGNRAGFEVQRLQGMGEALHRQIVTGAVGPGVTSRIYAPVGGHDDLLPYLIRRMLENGANSSFVARLHNEAVPLGELTADPVARIRALDPVPHPRIPLPADLYGADRRNSRGVDLACPGEARRLLEAMARAREEEAVAAPLVDGREDTAGTSRPVRNPADGRDSAGRVHEAGERHVALALKAAERGFAAWNAVPAGERAAALERAAGRLEGDRAALMALLVREAGKTVPDALGEVREAADFCRYYAARARELFGDARPLAGPAGESNELLLHGRGTFACISPWNFPLAIFTGQAAAALAAGNAVVAKPAEQTPLVAARATAHLHAAGIPPAALALLPGGGKTAGAALAAAPAVAGVAFTGSTETARSIHRALAAGEGPIRPLVAETGGQNAMVADATALPEQLADDVVASAFGAAGQRCSALRVLFLPEGTAARFLALLEGACAELVVGDPADLRTDVGPVIDRGALRRLEAHTRAMARSGRKLVDLPLPGTCAHGTFLTPKVYEIDSPAVLEREVFGPVLHVVRYAPDRLDSVIEAVNATGYGLTLGIHSRNGETVRRIAAGIRAGNVYVNRGMTGAVVGVQPFGGEGLSGTGPKAGSPFTLHAFAKERTLTVNTAAIGGNAALIAGTD